MATTTTGVRQETASRTDGIWLVGVGVGLAAFAAMMTTGAGFSVTDDLPVATMVDKIEAASGNLLIGGGVQGLVAMGLVVFGAFVRASLKRREPAGSLTPTVAFGGALLAAAMAGVAGAATQLASGMEGAADPAIPLSIHVLEESLFAGAFCAIALVAGAVAFAGLRRGAVARWFAGVSAFVAILLVVAQLVVPWAGWFPAVVWTILSSVVLRERSA